MSGATNMAKPDSLPSFPTARLGKSKPLWLDQAYGDEFSPTTPLAGEARADVAIIGGGYVGLWTAIELSKRAPGLKVVILEQNFCGAGASGRNSGIVMSWWSKIRALEKVAGTNEAVRLARASEAAIGELGAFCKRHCPEAQFLRGGWTWVATSPAHVGAWEDVVRRCAELDSPPFVGLSAQDLASRTGTFVHLGGVFESTAATIHPGFLVRGLRRTALDLGVHIYEKTRVGAITWNRPAVLSSGEGRVVADKVVIATNVWAAAIPGLRRRLSVIASDLIATAPIPGRLTELGWVHGEAIIDARQKIRVYRTTGDGRITFGRGGGGLAYASFIGSRFKASPRHAAVTARYFRRVYPMLGDVEISHNWSAAVDMSPSGLPMFGRLGRHRNFVYGVGWSGFGVAPSLVGARILASLVLDVADEWSTCGLVERPGQRFPPEPIRFLGGQMVRAAVASKEKAEDRGRQPSLLAVALSALAPGH